jgi:hypothetical protein
MGFDIGDAARCRATFLDDAGNPVDPSTVQFQVKDPSANIDDFVYGVDPEVVKDGTGLYLVDVPLDEAGIWYYRWSCTGDVQAAEEDQFTVKQSEFD